MLQALPVDGISPKTAPGDKGVKTPYVPFLQQVLFPAKFFYCTDGADLVNLRPGDRNLAFNIGFEDFKQGEGNLWPNVRLNKIFPTFELFICSDIWNY